MQTNERASATDEVMPEKTIEDLSLDAIRLHGLVQALEEIIDNVMFMPSAASNGAHALMPVVVEKAKALSDDLDVFQTRSRGARQ